MNDNMLYTDILPKTIITETADAQQLDEISLDQIGRGIGGVLGGVGKTAGAIAGVPQGIGRAIKKGYRGAVKGIGGEDDASSYVPGAAAGEKAATASKAEMPIGSGTINPRTGKPYVPSDFPSQPEADVSTPATPATTTAAAAGGRTIEQVQADLRKLESGYKMQKLALNKELAELESGGTAAPTGGSTGGAAGGLGQAISGTTPAPVANPEPMSIGGQKISPTDPLYQKIAAKSGIMQNTQLIQSIQALDKQKMAVVKQILQQKASGKLDEAALGAALKGAAQSVGRGAVNLAKGVKLGVTNPQAAANLSKNPNTGTATKVGRAVGRGLAATGQAIKAAPSALAKGAGATAGAWQGMKQAYAKGKEAGTKFVGQGPLSWDQLQVELADLSVEDAKALLSFVNQLGMAAGGSAAPAKKPAPTKSGAAGVVPGYTGRKPFTPKVVPKTKAVAEGLVWSKSFDPSQHLITQISKK